ncbi:MAG TPA: hypothetical protein VID47_00425 [Actinomycetota bacterium]
MPVSEGVRALEEGRAFVHLSGWRAFLAVGTDAVRWLNDLVTNRVDDIGPNELRRTLFLDRTGRVRADVHVGTVGRDPSNPDGFRIYQDPVQPRSLEDLLSPYVLSSDVELRPFDLGLGIVHSGIDAVQFMAWPGPRDRIGHFPVQSGETETGLPAMRTSTRIEATLQDAEVYRIRRGVPRFSVDFGPDFLPSEAAFDDLVDTTKGCFLGQESVSKVRNLGHPPRLVQAFDAPEPLSPMASITAAGEQVGRITSVAANDDGSTACIGWVRWEARDARLKAEGRLALARRAGS